MRYPIIVCDDDKTLAQNLARSINVAVQNITDENSNYSDIDSSVVCVANTFDQTVEYITDNNIKNGLYFLDIELSQNTKDKNGVDLAEFIKKQDPNSQIIFVTAYDKYAPLTYRRRIGAIDYINKSQSHEQIVARLQETLRNAFDNLFKEQKIAGKTFTYQIGRRIQKIDQAEIYFIESSVNHHKVRLVTATGESEFKNSISKLETENNFLVRVSQSALVNLDNITTIDFSTKAISFPNDEVVYFSRSYKKTIKQLADEIETIKVM